MQDTTRNPSTNSLVKKLKEQTSEKIEEINSKKFYEQRVKDLEEELALLTTHSSDTVYRLGYDKMSYDYVSPAIEKLLGYTPEEIKNINFRALISETKLVSENMRKVQSYHELEQERKNGCVKKWQADYLMTHKNGKKVWISDTSHPWINEEGKIIGSVGTLRDITDRISAEDQAKEELVKLANTDHLTGLANRREFFHRLEIELKRLPRSKSECSILLIDIDYFKKINDNYGHDVGDQVLAEISQLFLKNLRETDLAARIGGEEFAIFLPDTDERGAYFVADRIVSSVAKNTFLGNGTSPTLKLTVSIGIAGANMHDKIDPTELYKMADLRLYIAKNTGRNQVSNDEILSVH